MNELVAADLNGFMLPTILQATSDDEFTNLEHVVV
jgi:hypothetical protein